MTPSGVAKMLQSAAPEVDWAAALRQVGEPDVVGCWVSPGWSDGLTVEGHPEWLEGEAPSPFGSGLAGVVVARAHRRGKVSTCGFLVDAYCLGVKDAIGPRIVDDGVGLLTMNRRFFAAFEVSPRPVPLALAQDLVVGAVDFARGLGFEPHPDFATAAGHLGSWAGPSAITFGRDGKPFYIEGPHDDSAKVMSTLARTAGPDNFHFLRSLAM